MGVFFLALGLSCQPDSHTDSEGAANSKPTLSLITSAGSTVEPEVGLIAKNSGVKINAVHARSLEQ